MIKTSFHVEDDKLLVKVQQDVQPILDSIHEMRMDGHRRGADIRHAFRIPQSTLEHWVSVTGLKPYSKEMMEYAKKQIISGEYAKLKVHGL